MCVCGYQRYTRRAYVWMCVCVCMRERLCLGELSGRAQRAEKTCAHDTSQPHYTAEERERACTPAAQTMIPLPRSLLTPSPSSGSHQDSDDLMMRETTLIIHTQQTSPLAAADVSHRHTHAFQHTDNDGGVRAHACARLCRYTNKGKHRNAGLVCSYSMQDKENCRDAERSRGADMQTLLRNMHMPPQRPVSPPGSSRVYR